MEGQDRRQNEQNWDQKDPNQKKQMGQHGQQNPGQQNPSQQEPHKGPQPERDKSLEQEQQKPRKQA